MHPISTPRRWAVRGTAVLAAGLAAAAALGAGAASASSHREAPGVAGTPRLDTTDVYAYLSPDKPGTVTLEANWLPFSEPAGGPNFYTFDDNAWYEIAVDTNGDAKADVVYRWVFHTTVKDPNTFLYNTGPVRKLTDRTLNVVQSYDLLVFRKGRWEQLKKNLIAAPSNVGTASMPDYPSLRRQATFDLGRGSSVFAGQADDPFFLDLRVFNLLYGGDLSEVGNDTLRGYNVNAVAVQVPVSELGGAKNVIGVWSRTWKKGANGQYRQVSRLGNPLVNEVVIPIRDKDKFNASQPRDDAQFLDFVIKPGLPKVIEQVFKIKAPAEPRKDLVQVFLTGVPGLNQQAKVTPSELLRLNLTPFKGQTPNRLGVIGGDKNGFPNGRRLSDDVLDAALQVVEGELVGSPNDLGDKVDANDVAFQKVFPYVGLPNSGSISVNSGSRAAVPGAAAPKPSDALPGKSNTSGKSKSPGKSNSSGEPDYSAETPNAENSSATSRELDAQLTNTTDRHSPLPLAGAGLLGLSAFGGGWLMWSRRRRQSGLAAAITPDALDDSRR